MTSFTLYGAAYSVYTRIPRLVLEEANASYRLETIDIFTDGDLPAGYLTKHPFRKIPVLRHDEFEVYETDAIVDYIVSITGAPLIPADPQLRARMRQIMRIIDNYAYQALVWDIYVCEYLQDEDIGSEKRAAGKRVLQVLEDLIIGPFILGETLTLADCWTVPIVEYLRFTPTGRALLAPHPRIEDWWEIVSKRPSVIRTRFQDERKVPVA